MTASMNPVESCVCGEITLARNMTARVQRDISDGMRTYLGCPSWSDRDRETIARLGRAIEGLECVLADFDKVLDDFMEGFDVS